VLLQIYTLKKYERLLFRMLMQLLKNISATKSVRQKSQKGICSIPYYRREQYERLKEISTDKKNFSISYEEMMSITKLQHIQMEKKGFKVVKIDVDIEELIEWCQFRNLTLNPKSRTQFTMDKLKSMLSTLK
jgi:hypothetical protein